MASLRDFLEKSKSKVEEVRTRANDIFSGKIYIIIIIILVSLASFGLGRLSKIEEIKPQVKIIENRASAPMYIGADASNPEIGNSNQKHYVASKNSAKYHLPWCPGAERIKEENKIWFQTKEEAEKAGYAPAGNCKGL